MKLTSSECPKCHANLIFDKDNFKAYCEHCGSEYLIESGQLTFLASEKEKTKRYLANQNTAIEAIKHKWKNELIKSGELSTFAYFGFFIFIFIFIGAMIYFNSDTYKISKLSRTENRIISAIEHNKYKKALQLLNNLNIPNSLSKNDKKNWKEKIKYYQKLIPEKKREYDLKNPNNILAPLSSKQFQTKTGEEAKTIFINAGFKKIKLVEISGGGSIFNKKNTVDHILFGDKTEFTTDDYINKNDQIIIYYFEK